MAAALSLWLASGTMRACAAAAGVFARLPAAEGHARLLACVGDVDVNTALALSRGGTNLVACLLPGEERAEALLAQTAAAGARRVSVAVLAGGELPFVDSVVNAIAVGDFAEFRKAGGSVAELLRVVAPLGRVVIDNVDAGFESQLPAADVAGVARDGSTVTFARAWPKGMDVWTHFEHDAGRTSVSSDRAAGVPRGLRWLTGPEWTTYPVFDTAPAAFVSEGGRNFYWVAAGAKPKWTGQLTCRDAFNGLLLWERETPAAPEAACIVAVAGALFVREGARILRLDAATGREMARYDALAEMQNLLYDAGKLVLFNPGGQVKVLNAEDGRLAWEKTFSGDTDYWRSGDRVLAGDGRLFVVMHAGEKDSVRLACFDLQTGREVWQTTPADLAVEDADTTWLHLIAYADGYVLAANGSRRLKLDAQYGQKGKGVNYVLSGKDGKRISRFVFTATGHGGFASNVYLLDGLVWSKSVEAWIGWDPMTGEEKRRSRGPARTQCYPDHVVGSTILSGQMDFADTRSGESFLFAATRSACRTGFFPANGLVYTFPTRCFCFPMVRGFAGLSPSSALAAAPAPRGAPVRGPAFGAALGADEAEAWPTYRANDARGGVAATVLPAALTPRWSAACGEPVSAPTVAGGLVFTALPQSGRVAAFDAATGARRWVYNVGAGVDSPPTWYRGRLVFGAADGWVHALTAADGALAWKQRAAPRDRRLVTNGRLESVWPVHGSVLACDGVAYFTAGRHTFVDGGLFVQAVRIETGETLWRVPCAVAEGSSIADIPSTDGQTMYVSGNLQFALADGKALARGTGMAISAPMGMVTDNTSFPVRGGADNQRGQWVLADRAATPRVDSRLAFGSEYVKAKGAAGSLLSVDGERFFGFYQDPTLPQSTLFGREVTGSWSVALPPWREQPLKALLVSGARIYVAAAPAGGEGGGRVLVFDAAGGKASGELALPAAPLWNGLAAARGGLVAACADGTLVCLQGE